MNTNDLYLEYARVIEMCKGTKLEDRPWVCVKLDGAALRYNYGHPGLSAYIEKYEFAVAVLEERQVFVGDMLWLKDGHQFAVENDLYVDPKSMSWTPPKPKRTFKLNGVDLPCPEKRTQDENILFFSFDVGLETFYFQLIEDRDKTCKALINLLTEARDKT